MADGWHICWENVPSYYSVLLLTLQLQSSQTETCNNELSNIDLLSQLKLRLPLHPANMMIADLVENRWAEGREGKVKVLI